MHPLFKHVPPKSLFSAITVFKPSFPARIAASYPPGPPPMTAQSYSNSPSLATGAATGAAGAASAAGAAGAGAPPSSASIAEMSSPGSPITPMSFVISTVSSAPCTIFKRVPVAGLSIVIVNLSVSISKSGSPSTHLPPSCTNH